MLWEMKGLIIFVAFLSILIGFGYHKFDELTRPLPLPTFDTNKYWGPGDVSNYKEDKTIKPFKIDVDTEVSNKILNNNVCTDEKMTFACFKFIKLRVG